MIFSYRFWVFLCIFFLFDLIFVFIYVFLLLQAAIESEYFCLFYLLLNFKTEIVFKKMTHVCDTADTEDIDNKILRILNQKMKMGGHHRYAYNFYFASL